MGHKDSVRSVVSIVTANIGVIKDYKAIHAAVCVTSMREESEHRVSQKSENIVEETKVMHTTRSHRLG